MTTIFAAIGLSEPLDRAQVRRIVGAAGPPTGRIVDVHSGDGFTVASTGSPHAAGGAPRVATEERVVLVADATLYYLADLHRATGDAPTSGLTADSPLSVLRAFRVFGGRCVHHIEGDYAFAAWNGATRELFCARDFTGRRPLYYARYRGGVVVASSIACFVRLPGFHAVPDLATVGADAAGLFFAIDDHTCIRGVRALGAGCTLAWSPGKSLRVERVWHPEIAESNAIRFDEAALQLRGLLQDAALERIERDTPTAVWMSGGRDSTAVFASGMSALRASGRATALTVVSRSHPAGDSEREDEVVDAVARFWNAGVSWVDVKRVPMFATADASACVGGDSFQQPFQELTRALAREARARGANVVLDGHGGDFLFHVSRAYLGDLVARGQARNAWHDWRTIDGGREGIRGFARAAILPALRAWVRRAGGGALGMPFRGTMERVTPPWIDRRFLARNDLAGRGRALGPDGQPGSSASEREMRFCLTHPFFARVNAAMAGHALEHGVELRSPLLDRRVVEFALTRPREERNRAGDSKRLLRAAMVGLLPGGVLAPRARKQGTLATYFAYHMTTAGLAALRRTLPAVALADQGIIDMRELSRAVEQFAAEGIAYPHVEGLYCTLQAERWLRGQGSDAAMATVGAAADRGDPARLSRRGDTAPHLRRAGSPATLLETE